MSGPKPRVFRVLCMNVCEIESKAFRKSIRRMSPDFLFLIVCSMRFIRLIMQLPILLCLMYAFCCRPMILSTARLIHKICHKTRNIHPCPGSSLSMCLAECSSTCILPHCSACLQDYQEPPSFLPTYHGGHLL